MNYYVYAIGPTNGPTKIGFTNKLKSRLKAIQTGNPEKIQIHYNIKFDTEKEMRDAEKKIHKTLAHKRKKGEWFDILPEEAKLELLHLEIIS